MLITIVKEASVFFRFTSAVSLCSLLVDRHDSIASQNLLLQTPSPHSLKVGADKEVSSHTSVLIHSVAVWSGALRTRKPHLCSEGRVSDKLAVSGSGTAGGVTGYICTIICHPWAKRLFQQPHSLGDRLFLDICHLPRRGACLFSTRI